jgi:hypothetical protein
LPTGLEIDYTKSVTTTNASGLAGSEWTGFGAASLTPNNSGKFFADGSATGKVFPTSTMPSATAYSKVNANTLVNTNGAFEFYFAVPISGWSTFPIGVATQAPRSEVWVYGGNGFGSIGTTTRRFTTTETSTGSAITYSDSATNGASFTINEDGIYSISANDFSSSNVAFGITLNSIALSTSIQSIDPPTRLGLCFVSNSIANAISITLKLSVGDVIRQQNEGAGWDTTTYASFRITKVAN